MVHDRPWLPVCYAFKGFKGIQRDPKGQRLNDHHPPIAGRSSEISDAANFQQTSKEGILKKKKTALCDMLVTSLSHLSDLHLAQLKEACPWPKDSSELAAVPPWKRLTRHDYENLPD